MRPVRIGRHTALFLGGPEMVRAAGPTVDRIISPWLESLRDGNAEEFVRRLDKEDSARFEDLLAVLAKAGLLAEVSGSHSDDIDASAAFLGRFAALAPSARPTDAWAQAMRGGLLLDCSAELRPDLAEILSVAGLQVLNSSRGTRGRRHLSASFEVTVKGWRIIVGLYNGEGEEPAQLSARLVSECQGCVGDALSEGRPNSTEARSLGAAAALIAHWVIVATAGLPTVEASSFLGQGGSLRRGGDPPAMPLEPRMPIETRADSGPALEYPDLEEICRYAVGVQFLNGHPRRIAPSAGGFGVTQAICLIRGSNQAGYFSAFAADPQSGRLHKFLEVPRAPLEEILGPLSHAIYVLLVASAGILRARYGGLADRLAAHDAGVAMDHVARAARALGRGTVELGALTSNAVLKPLRLPLGDPRLIACGWVGFDDVQMQQSWSAAADLEPMARRRSVRVFSRRIPDLALVQSVERQLRVCREARRWRAEPATAMRLYRILRGRDGCFKIGEVVTSTTRVCANGADRCDSVDPRHFIRQPELAASPLVYALGYPAPRSNLEPSTVVAKRCWLEAGELLSNLWLTAHTRGLSGTLYGRVDVDELDLGHATIPAELCLCLGFGR